MTTTLIPLSNNSNRFVVILLKTDEKKKKCEENCSCCGVNCEFPHFRFSQIKHNILSVLKQTTIQFCRWFCLLITAATSKDTTRTEKKTFFGKQGP